MRTMLVLIFLFFNSLGFAQDSGNTIALIRKQVQEIDAEKGLKKKVYKNEDFLEQLPDGGGELTGYFKDGKLLKIVEWIGLSSCINVTTYYIKNGQLIFTYTKGKEFDYIQGTSKVTPVKLVMECRFYFNQNKLIKHLIKGATRCDEPPSIDWGSAYVQKFLKYKKLFKS